jgi:hypothetical protein
MQVLPLRGHGEHSFTHGKHQCKGTNPLLRALRQNPHGAGEEKNSKISQKKMIVKGPGLGAPYQNSPGEGELVKKRIVYVYT